MPFTLPPGHSPEKQQIYTVMGLIRHSDFIDLVLKGLVWLTFSITDNQNTHTTGPACSSHISELQTHKNTHNFLVYSFPIFLHTCISYQRDAGSLPFSLWSSWLTPQRGLTPSRTEREDEIHLWHSDSSYTAQPQRMDRSKICGHQRGCKLPPKRFRNLPKVSQEICGRRENVSYFPSTSTSPKMG